MLSHERLDLYYAQRGTDKKPQQRARHDQWQGGSHSTAGPGAAFFPFARYRQAGQDRQHAPGRVKVAEAPAMSLVKRDEQETDQRGNGRQSEQHDRPVPATAPPARGRQQHQAGYCPEPEFGESRQTSVQNACVGQSENFVELGNPVGGEIVVFRPEYFAAKPVRIQYRPPET